MTKPETPSPRWRQEVASLLSYVGHSIAAKALLVVLVALVLLELIWSGFRESFSKEYPFTVGIILSFVFVALGAIVVDIYLKAREEQKAERERAREIADWSPIAEGIVPELGSALFELASAVADAQHALTRAEADGERDQGHVARSIEDAYGAVRTVLTKRFPTVLQHADLLEAVRNAEQAATAAEAAASIVRHWDFDNPKDAQARHATLRQTVEFVLERRQWFVDRRVSPEVADESEAQPASSAG